MVSGEFRSGNLSGLLRDNSGIQFKSMSRGLDRGNSAAQSKENLVDMSTTSNEMLFTKGLKINSGRSGILKSSRENTNNSNNNNEASS